MNSLLIKETESNGHNRLQDDIHRLKITSCRRKHRLVQDFNEKVRFAPLQSRKNTRHFYHKLQKTITCKRPNIEGSDLILDNVSNQVHEVSDWREVLDTWNVVTEDLALNHSAVGEKIVLKCDSGTF
jgi:hypothetical protein